MMFIERWSRRLRYGQPVVVVSGLPRSGTSMAMKMLESGGMPLLIDALRPPDESNPAGYFEFQPVKGLHEGGDVSWLRRARGRAVKVISWLVTWLPDTCDYRIVFMERELDEVIASQNTMLGRRGEQETVADAAEMRRVYDDHLRKVRRFLESRRGFTTLYVNHHDVLQRPSSEARRIADFVERRLDVDRMAAAVDPRLYRSRSG